MFRAKNNTCAISENWFIAWNGLKSIFKRFRFEIIMYFRNNVTTYVIIRLIFSGIATAAFN